MATRYTHLELNQDVNAIAGHYTPLKEVRLKYNGREVLYVLSEAVVDASCCGTADYASALVPGYIVRWQAKKNRDGLPVSEVEPIADKQARNKIRKIIRETENVTQVEFW
jgi:hypothetical protein